MPEKCENYDLKYPEFCDDYIGFNGKFYTFPYCMTFLLKRFLNETKYLFLKST